MESEKLPYIDDSGPITGNDVRAIAAWNTRAPADLRSALEAETVERCAQIATDMQKGFGVMPTERLGSYNAACRDVADAIIALVGDVS